MLGELVQAVVRNMAQFFSIYDAPKVQDTFPLGTTRHFEDKSFRQLSPS